VRYEAWPDGGGLSPGRVVVTSRGREVLHLDFAPIERGIAPTSFPEGNRQRDRSMAVASSDVALQEAAPHVFTIDLAQANTRVTVAEFADHLMVIEGAYSSRLCDRIADVLRARFHKPVRYFAFSHLHGQYVGGVRTWVEEGATVLVPPSTAPLIDEIVKTSTTLRPDAFSKSPKPLHVETIADRRRLEDGTNAVDLINVESGHTDEYLLFYFPKQKVLLTGDLLFYVPGKPLSGRSKMLCHTVAKLGLDVDTFIATWPLTGYSTKNIVTAEEMKAACAEAK
jgi:glyoxylase-like metal-dependent hydrolase (beta-lactamase superfamily II)